MASSPSDQSDGPVEIVVKCDGKEIQDSAAILSVHVESEINRIPVATVTLIDGSVAENSFPLTDGKSCVPGTKIEIQAGYGNRAVKTIFKGIIVGQRLALRSSSGSTLELQCRDEAIKMTEGRRCAVFKKKTDSSIMGDLVKEAGLTFTGDSTSKTYESLVQYQCSNWDFLLARAEYNGLIICVSGGEVSAKKPDFSASPDLVVTYGLDVIAFEAENSSIDQHTSFQSVGWDIQSQAIKSEAVKPGGANKWGNISSKKLADVSSTKVTLYDTFANQDASELKTLASARSVRAELSSQSGQVTFQGNAAAKPGHTIQIKGVGDRFGGTALISGVKHEIENGDWITQTRLGHPSDWLTDNPGIDAPGAAGLSGPIRGLHVAKVTKLSDDPIDQKQIQVHVPFFGDDAEPIWARLTTNYATNASGIMFLPEIDDEVIVGFLQDDPSAPVILGSVHSSSLPCPEDVQDDKNDIKTIVTREKLKLTFKEDTKTIILETPAGNTVTIDDDQKAITLADQHGNTIKMDQGGIAIDSKSDISLTAAGNITTKSTADTKMSAANLSANANMSFSAAGNASAELKASGTVTVKGAMVMIN